MESEIIDFELERGRHGTLLGREEVVAEVEVLLEGARQGWVLVKGGPGLGKSALLAEWLKRREAHGQRVPHHFVRRSVRDWDKPEAIKRNLAAQVEALFLKCTDWEPPPDTRLPELLQRVSKEVLEPRQERLVLVVDGLDEVEAEADGANPLKHFLPYELPPGVSVLCASRPTYPYLSWLEGLGGVRTIDLDEERWAGSNERVVREYWEQARGSSRFKPPLTSAFVEEIVQRAQGNILYSVKLAEWLEGQPVEERRAELLPRGLEALLEESWERIQAQPAELRAVTEERLGVLAVAREALPESLLPVVAGWREVGDTERFLRVARAFLLEEKGPGRGEKAWRPFHELSRSFLLSKLGKPKEKELHLRLAQRLCQWPVERAEEEGFRESYALRHGVAHWLRAEQWEQARRLYTDVGYLEQQCWVAGVLSVEEALSAAAVQAPEGERGTARALARAIQSGAHHLRGDAGPLASYVYNWLLCSSWGAERLVAELHFHGRLPELRLRFPVSVGWNVRTLTGHRASVTGCAVTPDGRRAVSCSEDGTLKVWDVEAERELATLLGHGAPVTGCAVTPDGRRAVSSSEDGTLKVWDVERGRELATLEGHRARVTGCAVTADGRRVVSASRDQTVRVWDVETRRELLRLQGHRHWVTGCAVTADGRRVVSASDDETLRVWDGETGRELATLEGHQYWVAGCAVTADGRRAVSASWDGTLKVWGVEAEQELTTLKGHGAPVEDCAVTPDGRRVVSASGDGTLKVWEGETGRELATLLGHESSVNGCAVTADGRRVVSASADKTLKVWEVKAAQNHRSMVTACALMPDERRVVSASEDGTLKVWDVETGRELATLQGHSARVTGCAVTADGRRVVSASWDGMLKVWKAETGELLGTLEAWEDEAWEGHEFLRDNAPRVNGCAVTADGRRVVSASEDGTLKVWDVETGRELATLQGHRAPVTGCAVTVDGRRVVSASGDGTLKVWDLGTGRELATLQGHKSEVSGCVMTPDGRRVVSASWDGDLKVWDLETGRELATLWGHWGVVNGCAVTPDGRRVVSASDDRTLKVWDIDSGQCLTTLLGFTAFNAVAAGTEVICAGDVTGDVWILEPRAASLAPGHPDHRRGRAVIRST